MAPECNSPHVSIGVSFFINNHLGGSPVQGGGGVTSLVMSGHRRGSSDTSWSCIMAVDVGERFECKRGGNGISSILGQMEAHKTLLSLVTTPAGPSQICHFQHFHAWGKTTESASLLNTFQECKTMCCFQHQYHSLKDQEAHITGSIYISNNLCM